jgi:drug/metabolite transporter (DMT)-like permease
MSSNTATLPAPGPSSSLSPLIIACLAATWLVWGSTYLAIKYALISLPPFVQMGSRFLVAGLALMAWMRWRGAVWPTRLEWRNALLVGTLMLGGGMGGTAFAEQTVGSGLVVAFIAVVPVLMAAANAVMGKLPTRLEALGIACGLGGVLLLTQGAGFQASTAGLIAIAIACSAWCTGSLLSQNRFKMAPGATGFASEMICGGVVLLVIAAFSGDYPQLARQWPPQPVSIVAWAYLVLAGSLIAFNAYMVLLARSTAGLASSYCFVNPVIAMLLGVGIAGEVISSFEWASAVLVLLGVVLLLAGRRKD